MLSTTIVPCLKTTFLNMIPLTSRYCPRKGPTNTLLCYTLTSLYLVRTFFLIVQPYDVKGDTLFVANVGDSRAIVCTQEPGKKNTVRPLSVDQTPFRKDERNRIKRAGGHVLTIDQIEGLEVYYFSV